MIWKPTYYLPFKEKKKQWKQPDGTSEGRNRGSRCPKRLERLRPVLRFFGEQKVGPDDIFLGLFSRFSHKEIIKLGESFWGNICPNLFG